MHGVHEPLYFSYLDCVFMVHPEASGQHRSSSVSHTHNVERLQEPYGERLVHKSLPASSPGEENELPKRALINNVTTPEH